MYTTVHSAVTSLTMFDQQEYMLTMFDQQKYMQSPQSGVERQYNFFVL